MPGSWCSLFIGLTKKFVRVFPLHLMEKQEGTFWPTQYFLKPKLAVCLSSLPARLQGPDTRSPSHPGCCSHRAQVPAALSQGDSGDMVRRTPLNWAEPTGELSGRMGLRRFSYSSHMHIPPGKNWYSPPHPTALPQTGCGNRMH